MNLEALHYESLFHALMATIPSSILILDERLAVVTANHNFLEKSRASLNSILGRRLQDIIPSAFEGTALEAQIRKVSAFGDTLHRQRMSYRAPGVPLRIYSYSICPLRLQDGARGAVLVMDDVTDLLKLSEEVRRMQLHVASIVESAGDLIISTEPNGAIMTWNAAAERSTGFASTEVRGSRLADHIDEPENQEVEACFRNIAEIAENQPVEWPMRCRNGTSIPVSWRLSRMTSGNGEVAAVVVVGRNLVEQRAMEEQVRQGEKLAALGMVIGGIAHEIRNPLGVSSAAAQLLQRGVSSPALLDECVGKVISGIDRASLIVESLLRFARPGPIKETTRVNMVDVAKNALMFASGEAAAGTAVEWNLPSAKGVYAEGVQNLLELVVINLMLNAFQAMPDGGQLTIGIRRVSRDVIVEIGDTGQGIPESHITKIFDPFFTMRGGSRRSGLGLSVSHSIVRQHGGSVSVRTAAGVGTTFTIRLPVYRAEGGG
ncbi:PAS domain-containing sensor histidine kinase [Bradyrhizobium liaoningense]